MSSENDHRQPTPIEPFTQQILEASPNMMMLTTADPDKQRIMYVNAAFERVTGYTREECLGKSPNFLQNGDRDQPGIEVLRAALHDGIHAEVVLRNYRKDGTRFWNEMHIQPLHSADGDLQYFLSTQYDVTARIRAEQAEHQSEIEHLRHSEQRYRAIVENFPGGFIALYDFDLRYQIVNGQGLDEIGVTPEMMEGQRLQDFLPPEVYKRDEPTLLAALQGERHVVEVPFGGFYFRVTTAPVYDDHSNVIYGMVISQNITARKQAEDALRVSETNLKIAQSIARIGSWEVNYETLENRWSEGFYRICGVSSDEMQPSTENWMRILHPEDRGDSYAIVKSTKETSLPYAVERRIIRQDTGETRWVISRGEVVIDPDTGNRKLVGTIQDITERRKREYLIKQSEARYRSILAAMKEGLILYDETGTVVMCNDSAVDILDISRNIMIGTNVNDYETGALTPDGDMMSVTDLPAYRTLQDGKPVTGQVIGITKPDGTVAWILISTQPLKNPNDHYIYGVVSTFTDITEMRRMQDRALNYAIERERVNILSKFIRDTSHELRTPLSIISTSSYFLKRVDDPAQRERHAHKIEDQIKHLTTLIDMLLLMSKLDSGVPINPTHIHLSAIVEGCQQTIQARCDAQNQTFTVDVGSVRLHADADYMVIALTELLKNASHYTDEGGEVTLRAHETDDAVVIEVIDTGIGILPEDLPHVFTHFWRKDESHAEPGFGLGLTAAKRIVDMHQGDITVISTPDSGTTVQITLPQPTD